MVTNMITRKKLSILVVVSIICSVLFIPAGYSNAGSTTATISGIVSVPTAAPAGGISITVYSVKDDIYISETDTVLIPEGGTNVNYSITVPANTVGSTGYKVYYRLDTASTAYVRFGYYSNAGTAANSSSATLVDVSAGNASGINLMLIAGHTISGRISLPGGMIAPTGGLNGVMAVYNIQYDIYGGYSVIHNDYISFDISAGSTYADYTATVPVNTAGSGYTVFYWLNTASSVYVQQGYYSIGSTTVNVSDASLVDVSAGNALGINLILITGHTISGRISLPGDMAAPAGGLLGDIYIYPQGGGCCQSRFYIPEGNTGMDFSITVPVNAAGSGNKVCYYLYNAQNAYLSRGYYTLSGMTIYYASASLVDVSAGNVSNINMTFMNIPVVSGSVSLPAGRTAPSGGINVPITLQNVQDDIYSIHTSVVIPEGENNADYTLTVPYNEAGSLYKLQYWLGNANLGYVQIGYYSSGGTTANCNFASQIDVSGGSVPNIDMTLLTGNTISGRISLPGGMTAPAGGLEGAIHIPAGNGLGYSTFFNIASGSIYADYTATVPVNTAGSGYTVYYWLNSASSAYVQQGYYSIGSTTVNASNASLVDVSAGNASGINLTLIESRTISGRISLPRGMTAPAGGLYGEIYGFPQSGNGYFTYFDIAEGSTGADYSITVPANAAGSGYTVRYMLSTASSEHVQLGYYFFGGTTASASNASLVDVSAGNASDIDLTFIEGHTISGRILLPGGMTAPAGGLQVWSSLHGEGYYHSASFYISAGSTGVDYSVTAPINIAGSGYTVFYWLSTASSEYVQLGYYSIGGTTANYSSASLVDISAGNASDINLTLIEGHMISGRVSLPVGMTAPAGGLYGDICSYLQSGESYWTALHIPEGSTGADYSITVPANAAGSGYTVRYWLFTASSVYVQRGYYSSGGTTASASNATLVDVSAGNESNIDMEIILAITSTSCVFEGDLVRGIVPGTLIEGLTSGIQAPNGYTVKIVNNDGSEPPAGSKIGTGMKVQVLSGTSVIKEYLIVIYGDTTGDGNINAIDLLGVKRCILGLQTLTGAYATAANTNHDTGGAINVLDLLKIKRDILGLEAIVQ